MTTKMKQNERNDRKGLYERYVKRPMDLLLALIALIVLSPLFLVVAILVRFRLGSPVIFRQERPGLNEKIFTIYKFRTMTEQKEEDGGLLPDEERLTGFGAWLRSTSVDELPELVNIIKGDMSMVGPRPLLVEYLPFYNKHQKRRHEVKPGLSGIAQINGRNGIGWEDKFDYDVQYVDNVSFAGDWNIILRTIQTVIKKDGIHSENAVTMEAFNCPDKLRKTENTDGE